MCRGDHWSPVDVRVKAKSTPNGVPGISRLARIFAHAPIVGATIGRPRAFNERLYNVLDESSKRLWSGTFKSKEHPEWGAFCV